MPCRECQSPLHSSWECPLRYARVLQEPCPGFDAQGRKVPSAWAGADIAPNTRQLWRTYIQRHQLPRARDAPGVVIF